MPLDGDPRPEEIYPGEGSQDPPQLSTPETRARAAEFVERLDRLERKVVEQASELTTLRHELNGHAQKDEALGVLLAEFESVGKGPETLGWRASAYNRAFTDAAEKLRKVLEATR